MRIRRRPQAPAPSSSSLQPPSDPSVSAVTRTPQNAGAVVARNREHLDEDGSSGRPHAGLDLGQKPGAARRLALPPPPDNAEDCFRTLGAQKGGVEVHSSVVNNGQRRADRIKDNAAYTGGSGGTGTTYEWVAKVEGAARNGVAAPLTLAAKEEARGSGGGAGGAKKRRGPAVLVEGSRCSRVNGRGWRCSQPTILGYALCEHHLGKGRTRSAAAASSGRAGAGQLGRTEHPPRIPVTPAAVAVAVTASRLGEEAAELLAMSAVAGMQLQPESERDGGGIATHHITGERSICGTRRR